MQILIGNSDPDGARALIDLVRLAAPQAHVRVAADLDGLVDDADLYLLVLNNLGPYDREPAERVDRALAKVATLPRPVLALGGWPEDVVERAREAGAVWAASMPFDARALEEQVARYRV